MVKKRSNHTVFKPLVITLAILVIGGLGFWGYRLISGPKKPQTRAVVTVGKPVTPPPKSSPSPSTPSTNGQPSETNQTKPNSNPSGATDNGGTDIPNTPSSQWTTSATGYITVKSPVANSTIQDGVTLAGSAKVSQVSWRLIDNDVGVIAQGQLSVVSGNFSGTLHFKSQGTGGRLDVYSTNSQGVEYNEVQINVSF
ncbi:MAG TPA: Gmad2 immunoglobulin-like domain-containing protein [Verrucomicrobiae bacterium]|nr:Gmad2 immunoglobulin-like domain-containing protein [Verrucomicrobiae bacterium]